MDILHIEEKVTAILAPMVEELGYEFVSIEFVEEEGEWYLRVYIDNENGMTIDDCAKVSRPLSDKLDEVDPIDQGYYFEVSSPGVNRPIKKDKDFIRFIGSKVIITFKELYEGNETLSGVLKGLEDNNVLLMHNKKLIKINREIIKVVNLNDL